MIKKVAFIGLLAATAVLGNAGASSLAATNSNSGVSVLQSCNLAVPLNILAAGENNQGIDQGDCGSSSGGAVNDNSGVSVLQGCNTALPVNLLALGENNQGIDQGACQGSASDICTDYSCDSWWSSPSGSVNNNSGLSGVQLCNTAILLNILAAGENNQGVGQGNCGTGGSVFPGPLSSNGFFSSGPENSNSGLSLLQLVDTDLLLNLLGLGENNQYVGLPSSSTP